MIELYAMRPPLGYLATLAFAVFIGVLVPTTIHATPDTTIEGIPSNEQQIGSTMSYFNQCIQVFQQQGNLMPIPDQHSCQAAMISTHQALQFLYCTPQGKDILNMYSQGTISIIEEAASRLAPYTTPAPGGSFCPL
jgi:hypothetical protein